MARADGKTYRCKVTVKSSRSRVYARISKSIAISAGKTYTLKAKVKPNECKSFARLHGPAVIKGIVTVTAKGKLKAGGVFRYGSDHSNGKGWQWQKGNAYNSLQRHRTQPKADKTITSGFIQSYVAGRKDWPISKSNDLRWRESGMGYI